MFSGTGLEPCLPCPTGFFQSDRGRTQCYPCGKNILTSFQGSTSFSDCVLPGYCNPGSYFNTSRNECLPCQKGFYQPQPRQNHCLKCPGVLSTDFQGSTSISDCTEMTCNRWKGKRSGTIQSPNFPNQYPADVTCEWTVRSGGRKRGILIVIPHLSLANDNCSDYLVIRKSKSMRPLIEDIVNDSELFQSPNHKIILENRQFLEAMVDVVSQPNNYQKYMHLHRFFPESFIVQMWPKIHRFFDLPDLEND